MCCPEQCQTHAQRVGAVHGASDTGAFSAGRARDSVCWNATGHGSGEAKREEGGQGGRRGRVREEVERKRGW